MLPLQPYIISNIFLTGCGVSMHAVQKRWIKQKKGIVVLHAAVAEVRAVDLKTVVNQLKPLLIHKVLLLVFAAYLLW